MNREIKYRGQRINSFEWVYGYYVFRGGKKHQIVTEEFTFPFEVRPETVGQLTGLKDKHGKVIYCGDLYRTELTEKPRQVFFKNGAFCGGFTFDNCAPLAWDCERDEDTCNELYPCNTEYIEIIGNIHENPELLK